MGVNLQVAPDTPTMRQLRVKIIILTADLVILMALAGCSNPTRTPETPTPSPEATPNQVQSPTQKPTAAATPTPTPVKPPATEPTPVPAATAAPEPTVTSTPTPPQTRKDETPAGALSPLVLDDPMYDDPDVINALLSEAELACIKEIGPVMHLQWNWILPGYEDQEERARIIGCLDDEILARILLAETAEGVGPLSLESSTCVRAAFKVIDPRRVMLRRSRDSPKTR